MCAVCVCSMCVGVCVLFIYVNGISKVETGLRNGRLFLRVGKTEMHMDCITFPEEM